MPNPDTIQIDEHGYVKLVDFLGDDLTIVKAARVSYGDGTSKSRSDEALIRYLVSHAHTSPLEQCVLTFEVKLPIFVARQMVRHRTARLNEVSGRYSVLEDDFYCPPIERLNKQSFTNKQGSEEVQIEEAEDVYQLIDEHNKLSYKVYEELLKYDLTRELARIVLPVSLYTKWVWQMDLNNLFRFLHLRTDSHAQKEIRDVANAIEKLGREKFPYAFRAYDDYIKGSMALSAMDIEAIKTGDIPERMTKREVQDLENKKAILFG